MSVAPWSHPLALRLDAVLRDEQGELVSGLAPDHELRAE
jgi:hypothetical protein